MIRNVSVGRPSRSVRLRFKNPRYDRVVRINTESIARKMGFDEDDVFDISLAVEEAYANSIEHSCRHVEDLELEIVYQIFDDRIEISIQDSGTGFDGSFLHDNPVFPDNTSPRGRGLVLIKTLADHAEILSVPGAGTLIKILKRIKKGSTRSTG